MRAFEPFRVPLDEEEFARRTAADLNEAQIENVRNWGYPCVFEDFRFHMTLTGSVAEEKRSVVGDLLQRKFEAFIGKPLTIDALALFLEPATGADFMVFSRHALGAP